MLPIGTIPLDVFKILEITYLILTIITIIITTIIIIILEQK